MSAETSPQLEALRKRWQLEKLPQLGLQLAEEYRRLGNLESAVAVMNEALEEHPSHIASKVALCRYLVDGKRWAEVTAPLEDILRADPVHLVANKLLVKAYTRVGRLDDAREKLDIYEMLSLGDDEVEQLRAAIESGGEPETAADVLEPVGTQTREIEFGDSVESAPDNSDAVAETLDQLSEPLTADEFLDAIPASIAIDDEAQPEVFEEPAAREVVFSDAVEEPFGSDWESGGTEKYWQDISDEGIFAVPASSGEALSEAESIAESSEPSEPAEPAEPSEPGVSATLGGLYLEQGHKTEATETFERVLEREPENEVAKAGLSAVMPGEADSIALDGTPDASEDLGASAPESAERRRRALEAYLARIRGSVEAGI